MDTLSDAQQVISDREGMDAGQTRALLDLLMSGQLAEAEGGALLRSWAARGETGTELAATVVYLKERARRVPVQQPCFDVCGTGGSGLERFNVSTTVAFIAAAAGVPVAKHGNCGSRKPNGSFDLLSALGVRYDLEPEQEAQLQAETGVCFIFARSHHPAVGKVVPYRKAAGCRTIFNLAGPLANPATIGRQIIGTTTEPSARVLADALQQLGASAALVVWAEPGIDELSITGRSDFLRISDGTISAGSLDQPPHPGLDYADLPCGEAETNARLFHDLLNGSQQGPLRDLVCINAGAAIDLWHGRPAALEGPGTAQARSLLGDGSVRACFEQHRDLAQRLAPVS